MSRTIWTIAVGLMISVGAMAVDEPLARVDAAAPGDVITFDQYPNGTVITNQYKAFGVVFGGTVFITNDGAQPTTPVLSGTPRFEGPVVGHFVNPTTGALVAQYGLKVDVGYINNPGSVKITAYDFNAEEITHTFANAEGINSIDVTAAGMAYFRIEAVSDEAAGFSIDNLRSVTTPQGVVVTSMASLGDSYSSGEGLLPEHGLHYDCGTDLARHSYYENTTVLVPLTWSNGVSCDTISRSTSAPAGYKDRPRQTYWNLCHRHPAAYPNGIRGLLRVSPANSLFIACSGATTENVGGTDFTQPSYKESPTNVAGGELQLDTLANWYDARSKNAPDLITIGIGGNDARFADVISDCMFHDCLDDGTAASALSDVAHTAFPRLIQLFDTLRGAYPASTIAAFGYPSIVDANVTCPSIRTFGVGLTRPEMLWAQNELIPQLNQAIADAAAATGLTYIDITTISKGHEVCTDGGWINGVRGGNDIHGVIGNESFHLNQTGHRAIANWFVSKFVVGNQLVFKNPVANSQLRPAPSGPGALRVASVDAVLGQPCGDQCVVPSNCNATCVLQLDGANFTPNGPLAVTIHSDPVGLGQVTADANGEVHATLPIPGLEPGVHWVELNSPTGGIDSVRANAIVNVPLAGFVSRSPIRILDTRPDGPQVGYSGAKPTAGQSVALQVTGVGGVPTDASSVVLNVTATTTNGDGFITVWPCDSDQPLASNLNHGSGVTIPNLVIVKVGTDGTVCLYTQSGTHLVADLSGWFPAGSSFTSESPVRALDTRPNGPQIGYVGTKPAANEVVELPVAGAFGVPDDADAVVLNVTATEADASGYVTVWPCGEDRPLASNLNDTAGGTIANLVSVKIGAGGKVCLYIQSSTHLVADVQGWFPASSSFESQPPVRVLDTRPGPAQTGYSGPKPAADQTTQLAVTGPGGVPTYAGTVVLNVTATEADANGYVTIWPCGADRPVASNLNVMAGATIANLVVVKIGAGGDVCLYTQNSVHLIADIQGYSRD